MKITAIGIYRWTGAESEPILLGVAADVLNFGYFQRQSVREMITFLSRTIVQRTQPGQRQTVKQDDYFCHVHVRDTNLAGIVVADSEYPTTAGFAVVTKVIEEFMQQIGEGWRSATGEVPAAVSTCEQAIVKYQVRGRTGAGQCGAAPPLRRPCAAPAPCCCSTRRCSQAPPLHPASSPAPQKGTPPHPTPCTRARCTASPHPSSAPTAHPPAPPHAVASAPQDPAAADKLTKIQRDLDDTKIVLHQTIDSVLRRGEKLDTLVDKSADLSLASQVFYKQARKTNACCKLM
jgi:hypothetical protein